MGARTIRLLLVRLLARFSCRSLFFFSNHTPSDNPRKIDYLSHSPCVSIIYLVTCNMATNISFIRQLPSSTPMR